jgi:hypothetical protein
MQLPIKNPTELAVTSDMSALPKIETSPPSAAAEPANEVRAARPADEGPRDAGRAIRSFTIIGATSNGKPFRPSDWCDRLCGVMSSFGSQRKMRYSPFVRPGCWITGEKCVFVDARLYEIEPLAFNFLMHFARDNDLRVDFETGESDL